MVNHPILPEPFLGGAGRAKCLVGVSEIFDGKREAVTVEDPHCLQAALRI